MGESMSHVPCTRCKRTMTLFWWPLKIGEISGEICDSCMVDFRRWVKSES